ncbi:uncharacterized protein TNCV_3279451 [Trichonephila clavipes]|nr:uncharacterized protein TNCV_3279451 [Trichonephila clavipes]
MSKKLEQQEGEQNETKFCIRNDYLDTIHSNSWDAQLAVPNDPDMLDWRPVWGLSKPRKGSNNAETVSKWHPIPSHQLWETRVAVKRRQDSGVHHGAPHTNTIHITTQIESRFIAEDNLVPFHCSLILSCETPLQTQVDRRDVIFTVTRLRTPSTDQSSRRPSHHTKRTRIDNCLIGRCPDTSSIFTTRAPVSSRTIASRLSEGHLVSQRPLRVLPMIPTHRHLHLD